MGANEKHAATYHGVRHDPDLNLVRKVYAGASPVPSYDERAEAFDRMIAKVRAEAKAEAWDECANHISDVDDFAPPRLAGELKQANPYKEQS